MDNPVYHASLVSGIYLNFWGNQWRYYIYSEFVLGCTATLLLRSGFEG